MRDFSVAFLDVITHRIANTSSDSWFGLLKTTPTLSDSSYFLDGNPSTFRNWRSGEPNEDVYCVRLVGSECDYADRSCDYLFSVLCKMPTVA